MLVAGGCSSSSGNGAGTDAGGEASAEAASGQEASTGDAGSGEAQAAEAAAACNTLANGASSISVQQVAQNPPSAGGGPIVDGTYFLTDATIYTGPGGPTGPGGTTQTTIQITGSTVQVVVADGQPPSRTTTLATSGVSFTSTDTCPDTAVQSGSYTATTTSTSTTFVVILDGGTDDAGARTLVETFTKQP